MDKEYVITITGIIAVVLAVIIGLTIYNTNVTNKMTQLIESGQDPIKVGCAFRSNGNESICVLSGIKQN